MANIQISDMKLKNILEDNDYLLVETPNGSFKITANIIRQYVELDTEIDDIKALIPKIVNDLETGGTDKVLSAEQGKILAGDRINVVKNNIVGARKAFDGTTFPTIKERIDYERGMVYDKINENKMVYKSGYEMCLKDTLVGKTSNMRIQGQTWDNIISLGANSVGDITLDKTTNSNGGRIAFFPVNKILSKPDYNREYTLIVDIKRASDNAELNCYGYGGLAPNPSEGDWTLLGKMTPGNGERKLTLGINIFRGIIFSKSCWHGFGLYMNQDIYDAGNSMVFERPMLFEGYLTDEEIKEIEKLYYIEHDNNQFFGTGSEENKVSIASTNENLFHTYRLATNVGNTKLEIHSTDGATITDLQGHPGWVSGDIYYHGLDVDDKYTISYEEDEKSRPEDIIIMGVKNSVGNTQSHIGDLYSKAYMNNVVTFTAKPGRFILKPYASNGKTNSIKGDYSKIDKIMVRKSNTKLPYVESQYQRLDIPLPFPYGLKRLKDSWRQSPDIYDEIYIEDGRVKCRQSIGIFDANAEVDKIQPFNDTDPNGQYIGFKVYFTDKKNPISDSNNPERAYKLWSNQFVSNGSSKTWWTGYEYCITMEAGSGQTNEGSTVDGLYFIMRRNRFGSNLMNDPMNELKYWLKTNRLVFFYTLNKPIIHDLSNPNKLQTPNGRIILAQGEYTPYYKVTESIKGVNYHSLIRDNELIASPSAVIHFYDQNKNRIEWLTLSQKAREFNWEEIIKEAKYYRINHQETTPLVFDSVYVGGSPSCKALPFIDLKTYGTETNITGTNRIRGKITCNVPVDLNKTQTRLQKEASVLLKENEKLSNNIANQNERLHYNDGVLAASMLDLTYRMDMIEANKTPMLLSMAYIYDQNIDDNEKYEFLRNAIMTSNNIDKQQLQDMLSFYYSNYKLTEEHYKELMSLIGSR